MNLFVKRDNRARIFTIGFGLAAIMMFAAISPAFGQRGSEDRDDPLELSNDVLPLKVSDELDGTATELFYAFTARPGKWTLTFDVKAAGTNSGAYFDIFGPNSRAMLSNVLVQGIDSGSDRVVKTLQIAKQQTILIRVKGIRYGDSGGQGTFAFTLAPPPKPVAKAKGGKAAQ